MRLAGHARSLLVVFGCLVVAGAAMAWNLHGFPGRVNDDEGTYVARAWAMIGPRHLANYTYFWDHPFLGWAVIAGWLAATGGLARGLPAVMAGRELMLVITLASCTLLYVLARRLGMNRFFAAVAVLMFGLSPIAIWYHRMVSLDNLATAWALAAFVLATSGRRSLAATVWSGVCFAAATWSKETVALLLPALVWLLAQHLPGERAQYPPVPPEGMPDGQPRMPGMRMARSVRHQYLLVFLIVYAGIVGLYPLLAVVKGELLPGRGHVSLLGEAYFQLAGRASSGSLLDAGSVTFAQARAWVMLDPWLTAGGAVMVTAVMLLRRYRPVALAFGVQFLYLVKGGYVPYAFVTAMLPFAAIAIAGALDWCWHAPPARAGHARGPGAALRLPVLRVPVLAAGAACAVMMAPAWSRAMEAQAKVNGFAAQEAAVAWAGRHVPRGDLIVCDDYLWPDLKLRTGATPVYLWTIDDDPAVMRALLPGGYQDVSYLVLDPGSPLTYLALPGRPTLVAALRHSRVIERFGSIDVYQVTRSRPAAPGHPPATARPGSPAAPTR
jgi:hypothetical protein